MDTLERR